MRIQRNFFITKNKTAQFLHRSQHSSNIHDLPNIFTFELNFLQSFVFLIASVMAFARPIPNETWKNGSQRFMDMAKELYAKGLDYHIIKQMAGDTISIQEKMM